MGRCHGTSGKKSRQYKTQKLHAYTNLYLHPYFSPSVYLYSIQQVTVVLLALCQAWIGVFSAVVYSGPTVALRVREAEQILVALTI